jgi:hypothetical protein
MKVEVYCPRFVPSVSGGEAPTLAMEMRWRCDGCSDGRNESPESLESWWWQHPVVGVKKGKRKGRSRRVSVMPPPA